MFTILWIDQNYPGKMRLGDISVMEKIQWFGVIYSKPFPQLEFEKSRAWSSWFPQRWWIFCMVKHGKTMVKPPFFVGKNASLTRLKSWWSVRPAQPRSNDGSKNRLKILVVGGFQKSYPSGHTLRGNGKLIIYNFQRMSHSKPPFPSGISHGCLVKTSEP